MCKGSALIEGVSKWTLLLLLLCVLPSGCGWRSHEISSQSFRVLTGFTFVGSGPYKGEQSNEAVGVARYGTKEQTLPIRPLPGTEYLFIHRRPVDNEKLALVEIPRRLKDAGIEIVKAPASGRDLMYPFIGGPLFRIQIREGSHEGLIYNSVDQELVKGISPSQPWATESYTLVWLR